jgi:hypothetical protein
MAKATSQVHVEKTFRADQMDGARLLEFLAAGVTMREGVFSKRRYPGEYQGECLAARLNSLAGAPIKQRPLLRCLHILKQFERACKTKDVAAIERLRKQKKGLHFAYDCLVQAASRKKKGRKPRCSGVHEEGLIVGPVGPAGQAALAALLLDNENRLDRIKQCLHCNSWFYARFKHQSFCPDSKKKCQWNHYHTLAWRKQHREQNRKHQKAYRKRLFTKPGGQTN